jgi:hypothetical protein
MIRRAPRFPRLALLPMAALPTTAWAMAPAQDFTAHWSGLVAVGIFVAAYVLVIAEESTGLRKSQPVMLAAGAIWAVLAIASARAGLSDAVHEAVRDYLLEYRRACCCSCWRR